VNRLRPWVKLPRVTCERCDEQATHRVTAATLDVADQDGEAGPIALVIAFHNVRWERIPGDSVWRMVPDFIEEMRELRRFRKT
jgi:hypothetical protein